MQVFTATSSKFWQNNSFIISATNVSNFLSKQFIHLSHNLFQRMERLSYISTNALEKK